MPLAVSPKRPAPPRPPLVAPCTDSAISTGIAQFGTSAVHSAIAKYLADDRNGEGKFQCSSSSFHYEGMRDKGKVRIVSRYNDSGRHHAEYISELESERTRYRQNGVFRSRWPSGAPKSVEYYCVGLPVGFHQCFDTDGNLRYVIDYSKSDLEANKPIPMNEWFRAFYESGSHATRHDLPSRSQLFREVYAVKKGKVEKIEFGTADIFGYTDYGSNWQPIDPQSSVTQWTAPGNQGYIRSHPLSDRLIQIENRNFDYQGFSDVYRRHKKALSDPRQAQAYNADVLRCPWIDAAMALASEDPRFTFVPMSLPVLAPP